MKPDVFILFFPVHSFIRKKPPPKRRQSGVLVEVGNFRAEKMMKSKPDARRSVPDKTGEIVTNPVIFGFFASLRLSGELLLTIFFISGIDNYIGSRYNHITIYRMTIYRTAMEVSNMPGTPALTEATYYILLSLYRPRHGYGIMQQTEE